MLIIKVDNEGKLISFSKENLENSEKCVNISPSWKFISNQIDSLKMDCVFLQLLNKKFMKFEFETK